MFFTVQSSPRTFAVMSFKDSVVFFVISSIPAKSFPLDFLPPGEQKKMPGTRSGEYGGWVKWVHAIFGQKVSHTQDSVQRGINSLWTIPLTLKKKKISIQHWTSLDKFWGVTVMMDASTGLTTAPLQGHNHSTSFHHQWLPSKKGLDQLPIVLSVHDTHSSVTAFDHQGASEAPVLLQLFIPCSSVKIYWQELQDTPLKSTSLSTVRQQSSKMPSWIFMMFSSVQVVDGHPERCWSPSDNWPFLRCANLS